MQHVLNGLVLKMRARKEMIGFFLSACVGFISAQSSLLDHVPWYLDLNKVLTFYRILSWCPLLGVNTEERKKERKKEEVLFVNLFR